MEFRSDGSGARASGKLADTGSTQKTELDLYDELSSFTALSPEEQRKELERVVRESAQLAVAVEEPVPVRFDFIEQSDLPASDEPESNPASEPAFDLGDESLFEPLDQRSDAAPAESVFAFLEEQQSSQAREGSHLISESEDPFDVVSPLEDFCSGVTLRNETTLKCERCGAGSNLEDLFCPSCAKLLGELDW
jgi:hypothetical protein